MVDAVIDEIIQFSDVTQPHEFLNIYSVVGQKEDVIDAVILEDLIKLTVLIGRESLVYFECGDELIEQMLDFSFPDVCILLSLFKMDGDFLHKQQQDLSCMQVIAVLEHAPRLECQIDDSPCMDFLANFQSEENPYDVDCAFIIPFRAGKLEPHFVQVLLHVNID